jgi:peptidyl-prolyl cis-trans isomerase D
MVSPQQVVPAAPAPLATIRDQVAADWINDQALNRARTVADAISAKASQGMSLADAAKQAGVALPPVAPLGARRIQLATAQGQVPAALRVLFSIPQGKSRVGAAPGKGFYVVKVNKIVPGNALFQPALIGQMQTQLQQTLSEDYAREFVGAIRSHLNVKRNDSAIQALKSRLASSGS